jgi:uncharacterized phage protein (TIGR02218 family)
MPRTISVALQAHLDGENTTLALCWKIKRRDAVIKAYTDHDDSIVYSGDTYTPLESGAPSNYRQGASLAPANMDLAMAFASATGTDAELRAGLYDYAEVWTFLINWADTSMGIVKLAYGRLGEVELRDNQARIEMRSLTQLLAVQIGRIYTPECDATLGDTRCAVVMTTFTKTGTVGAVTSRKVFVLAGAAAGQVADYYNYGKITFSSGLNTGITMQIESYVAATNLVTLYEPMPFTVVAGDAFTAYAGCDRRFATCKTRFNNKDNFRGFPHIPGMDKALTVPNNQKWTED